MVTQHMIVCQECGHLIRTGFSQSADCTLIARELIHKPVPDPWMWAEFGEYKFRYRCRCGVLTDFMSTKEINV